jgi:hypothetical protein
MLTAEESKIVRKTRDHIFGRCAGSLLAPIQLLGRCESTSENNSIGSFVDPCPNFV